MPPDNQDCIYTISQPNGTLITITFQSMDIEHSRSCSFDYLVIIKGKNESQQSMMPTTSTTTTTSMTTTTATTFETFGQTSNDTDESPQLTNSTTVHETSESPESTTMPGTTFESVFPRGSSVSSKLCGNQIPAPIQITHSQVTIR